MGAFCCTLPYRHVVDPASFVVNELDKRIERKKGQKTAEQLAMQNGRFADEPDRQRERLEKRLGPQEEGKWGYTREMLTKAQNISQFAKHLNLTQRHMHDALSQFQALDADGNGVIDKREFAGILKMDPDSDETSYMFNALDVDRNGQLNYKEFMVVAAHFNSVRFYFSWSSMRSHCIHLADAQRPRWHGPILLSQSKMLSGPAGKNNNPPSDSRCTGIALDGAARTCRRDGTPHDATHRVRSNAIRRVLSRGASR